MFMTGALNKGPEPARPGKNQPPKKTSRGRAPAHLNFHVFGNSVLGCCQEDFDLADRFRFISTLC